MNEWKAHSCRKLSRFIILLDFGIGNVYGLLKDCETFKKIKLKFDVENEFESDLKFRQN